MISPKKTSYKSPQAKPTAKPVFSSLMKPFAAVMITKRFGKTAKGNTLGKMQVCKRKHKSISNMENKTASIASIVLLYHLLQIRYHKHF